ncbi:MAG: LysR family transcriptional regulator [Burkholderiaceae bacterium]
MDMNLLTALDALLEHNSVVAAAERLHLTPPAVSRTLARIRHVTGDDILVRSGRTMVATPYALSIRARVRELVEEASTLLLPRRVLDLQTLDRVFTVRGHDALLGTLSTPLIATLTSEAPSARVRLLGEPAVSGTENLRDEVDLDVGATTPVEPEITYQVVGSDSLVMAIRRGHPLADAPPTVEQLAEITWLNVSRRGRFHDHVDDAIASLNLNRNVAATLPTCAAALEVVARTNLATIVTGALCTQLCEAFGVVTRPLPLDLPPSPVVLSWHRRFRSDPAHEWLRSRVADILRIALETGGTPPLSRQC